jgi:hypothetical protein
MPTTAFAVTVTPPVANGYYRPTEVRFEDAVNGSGFVQQNPGYLTLNGDTPFQERTRITDVTTFYFVSAAAVRVRAWVEGDDIQNLQGTPGSVASPAQIVLQPQTSGVVAPDLISNLSGRFASFGANGPRPAGVIAQTLSRSGPMSNVTLATSGRLHLVAVELARGDLVSSISFFSATTAAVSPTNQWFALFDGAVNRLEVTNDDLTNAWNANSKKTLSLASPYTVPAAGIYYLGVCVVAATVPTFAGATVSVVGPAYDSPPVQGHIATGLTNPASCPVSGTLTATASIPYATANG